MDPSESPRWLEGIRRRLAARMPLATRLQVRAPRYIDFSLRATIEVVAGRDPVRVLRAVEQALRERLVLVGPAARLPGVPLSKCDLLAWIGVVDGVRRVVRLTLVRSDGAEVEEIKVPSTGLPRFDRAASVLLMQGAAGTADGIRELSP